MATTTTTTAPKTAGGNGAAASTKKKKKRKEGSEGEAKAKVPAEEAGERLMQQSLQKWFTPELHAAITEILPSNDPLDAPDFDPVDYINHMFPNEQSLVDVDKAISRLKLKINQTDETILREIRNQSNSSSSSHSTSLQASGAGGGGNIGEDLHQAKGSIQELFSKIHDIRRKAADSERMVQDICRDIKSLDFAKRHLTATITALKRLDMLVSSVDQLEVMSHKRQYREVGNLLEAITELSTAHFQQYRAVPKIAALNEKVTAIKQSLHDQIYKEFEGASKGREHISNAMNLTEACFVVDALGSEAKEEFIEWFAKQQLRDYEMAFASGSGGKSDRLEYTERRFEWLWQELQYYDQQFARIFPLGWNMDQVICQQFCRITRQHLTDILERNATTLGVELLTAVMKRTLDFEFKLSKRFVSRVPQIFASAEMRAAVLADGENGGENADEEKGANEIGDDDDMEDETELNPNSAEAIKRRLRRFQQKLAKQKEKRTGGQPGMAPIVTAQTLTADGPHQFKGVISASFEPYLSIFIDHLNTRMEREMKRRLEEEKWDIEGDMDEEDDDELMSSISKVARSATDMIHDFYKIMKECNALSKGQPFFDLYRLYKKFLSQYAKALDAKLSAVDKSNVDYIALSNAEQRMTLLILNTAEYCANTTSSMSDTVIKLIDPAFVDNIDLTEQREAFEDVLAHSSKVLVRGLEGKLEPALAEMTKMSWATWEAVGDQSAYVTHILTVLSETIPLYRTWLSKSGGASGGGGGGLGGLGAGGKVDVHFQHFCNQFIYSFIPRLIENIYKCKQISEIGAEQMLFDITTIKKALIEVPTMGRMGGTAPKTYVKQVNKGIGKAETLLKIVMTPQESLLETYRALVVGGSEADFQRVMELKGMKKEEGGTFFKSLMEQYSSYSLPRSLGGLRRNNNK